MLSVYGTVDFPYSLTVLKTHDRVLCLQMKLALPGVETHRGAFDCGREWVFYDMLFRQQLSQRRDHVYHGPPVGFSDPV